MCVTQNYQKLQKGDLGRLCRYYGKNPTNTVTIKWQNGSGSSPPGHKFLNKPELIQMVEAGDVEADTHKRPRAWVVYASKAEIDTRYSLAWKRGGGVSNSTDDGEARQLLPEFEGNNERGGGK